MPKIKGWKKIGESKWKNEMSGFVLKVEEFFNHGAGKVTGYYTSIKSPDTGTPTEFNEITQGDIWKHKGSVIKETVRFMKDNEDFP